MIYLINYSPVSLRAEVKVQVFFVKLALRVEALTLVVHGALGDFQAGGARGRRQAVAVIRAGALFVTRPYAEDIARTYGLEGRLLNEA